MKKYTVLTALLLLLTLTGCGAGNAEADRPAAVCYAIANTANSQGLNLNTQLVQQTAYDTILGYGYVSAVNIDGSPEIVCAESYEVPEKYKKASSEKRKSDAEKNASLLLSGLQTVIADDAEVDYLEGLRLAVRSLAAREDCGEKTIIVVGTGLSSSGVLDFRNHLLSAQPEDVVEALAQRKEIPDFTGINVVWQQLGDVAAPQQPLSQEQLSRLRSIWEGIIVRGGGSFRCSEAMALQADTAAVYPCVSTVELTEQEPIRFEPETLAAKPEPLAEPLVLTQEQVCFVGDQAVYLHPEQAQQTIRPIADYLTENDGVEILLVGTTAGDATTAYTASLSRSRADTVRDTLVELGVSADRITTLGMGSSDPWHISGAGTDSPLAEANRKVVILDASTPMARSLLSGGD